MENYAHVRPSYYGYHLAGLAKVPTEEAIPTRYPRRIAFMKPALCTRAHARIVLINQATNSIANPPSRRPNNCPIGPQPSIMSYKKDSLHVHYAFSDLAGVTRTRSHAGDLMANQVAG
jgi:hypothetical protein